MQVGGRLVQIGGVLRYFVESTENGPKDSATGSLSSYYSLNEDLGPN